MQNKLSVCNLCKVRYFMSIRPGWRLELEYHFSSLSLLSPLLSSPLSVIGFTFLLSACLLSSPIPAWSLSAYYRTRNSHKPQPGGELIPLLGSPDLHDGPLEVWDSALSWCFKGATHPSRVISFLSQQCLDDTGAHWARLYTDILLHTEAN